MDLSRRPLSCPHQMPPQVEAAVLELRRAHPYWGPRRIAVELARRVAGLAVPESAVYRCLVRAGLIEPESAAAPGTGVEAVGAGPADGAVADGHVGGFLMADGSQAKALTGVDDHSRFWCRRG